MSDVEALVEALAGKHSQLDVLINNAGVYNTPYPRTKEGLDVRFAVNAIAPYLLTRRLSALLGSAAPVINLSSAAQAPVDLEALAGRVRQSDAVTYAQSKLALTMWSRSLALALEDLGSASGQYYDNDSGQFASPHPDALDPQKSREVVGVIETILSELSQEVPTIE